MLDLDQILRYHTLMKSIFIPILDDVWVLISKEIVTYYWFCDPGSHIEVYSNSIFYIQFLELTFLIFLTWSCDLPMAQKPEIELFYVMKSLISADLWSCDNTWRNMVAKKLFCQMRTDLRTDMSTRQKPCSGMALSAWIIYIIGLSFDYYYYCY